MEARLARVQLGYSWLICYANYPQIHGFTSYNGWLSAKKTNPDVYSPTRDYPHLVPTSPEQRVVSRGHTVKHLNDSYCTSVRVKGTHAQLKTSAWLLCCEALPAEIDSMLWFRELKSWCVCLCETLCFQPSQLC